MIFSLDFYLSSHELSDYIHFQRWIRQFPVQMNISWPMPTKSKMAEVVNYQYFTKFTYKINFSMTIRSNPNLLNEITL